MKSITRRGFTQSIVGTFAALSSTRAKSFARRTTPSTTPDLDQIANLSMTEASEQLVQGSITSALLTTACLERIRIYNPKLDAFITVLREAALQRAAEMDTERQAGRVRGPLHGIPIALKDNIDTRGIRTTAGSHVYDDRVPTADAEVTRRLLDAGAILLGKTNLDEFAEGISYFGSVRNPWNLDRDPSGSSGGSAAAVAAGLAFGALGTDTGGSVRAPAARCGVVGLKPTYGLVSVRGIVPNVPSVDHCGPIARTVDDAALLLNELAGYDGLDITSVEHQREDYVAALNRPIAGFRIGIPRAPFFDHMDEETTKSIEEAIRVLASITRQMTDATLPPTGSYYEIYSAEMYAYHESMFERESDRYMLATRMFLKGIRDELNSQDRPCTEKMTSYIRRRWDLMLLRRKVDEAFTDIDVVVLPTHRVMPWKLNAVIDYVENPKAHNPSDYNWDNCAAFNVLGLPAISIPCGFSHDGLPIGLMIAGPRFAEGKLLALARAYERQTKWEQRRPPLTPDTAVPPIRAP
jgi:aspartyl-tRNA(Asn)/glutamyl-tRNA(Gln) amidotransferase subunit A